MCVCVSKSLQTMGLKSRFIKVQNIAEIHGDEEFLNSWETYTLTKSIHEVHIFFFQFHFP